MLVSPFSVMPLDEYTDLAPREPLGLEYLAAAAGSRDVQILARAALSRNWSKMAIILIFGFRDSFDVSICF